jgi:hypothetical protein
MGLYAAAHDWSRVAGSASASLLSGRGAAAEDMNEMAGSTQLYQLQHSSLVSGNRAPFTSGQWEEFAHQDLIFKYMMAGLNVPQELLNPICSRSTGPAGLMNSMTSSCHNAANRELSNRSSSVLISLNVLACCNAAGHDPRH